MLPRGEEGDDGPSRDRDRVSRLPSVLGRLLLFSDPASVTLGRS